MEKFCSISLIEDQVTSNTLREHFNRDACAAQVGLLTALKRHGHYPLPISTEKQLEIYEKFAGAEGYARIWNKVLNDESVAIQEYIIVITRCVGKTLNFGENKIK